MTSIRIEWVLGALLLVAHAARASPAAVGPGAPETVAAEFNPATALPVPAQGATGDVPLSRPIAPIPLGLSPWAVSLSAMAGVADPFYGKVATWLSVRRGLGGVAVEVFGGRSFSWSGPALSLCTSAVNCATPGATRLGATPGNLGYLGGASAVWRLAEGKLSVGGLPSNRFSLEVSLGAAAVQYTIVETTTQSFVSPGARAGLAVEAGLTSATAVRLEFQDLVYPTDIRNEIGVEQQLFAGATFSWRLGVPP